MVPHLTRRASLALLASAGAMPASAADSLSFDTLYGPATAAGIALSPAAKAMVGDVVTLRGFMAPPLKPELSMFVLTRTPMSTCPFCSSAADWPPDIVVAFLRRTAEPVPPSQAIAVTGILDDGVKFDPGTGFVSLVRLLDAIWRPA